MPKPSGGGSIHTVPAKAGPMNSAAVRIDVLMSGIGIVFFALIEIEKQVRLAFRNHRNQVASTRV
jgi:hypothetical protein